MDNPNKKSDHPENVVGNHEDGFVTLEDVIGSQHLIGQGNEAHVTHIVEVTEVGLTCNDWDGMEDTDQIYPAAVLITDEGPMTLAFGKAQALVFGMQLINSTIATWHPNERVGASMTVIKIIEEAVSVGLRIDILSLLSDEKVDQIITDLGDQTDLSEVDINVFLGWLHGETP